MWLLYTRTVFTFDTVIPKVGLILPFPNKERLDAKLPLYEVVLLKPLLEAERSLSLMIRPGWGIDDLGVLLMELAVC